MHGLSVHIQIAGNYESRNGMERGTERGTEVKNVLKYAAPYRPPRFAMRSWKTAAQLEGFLSPGSKVDMWTAERCLYTNECKPGSFLLLLAGASLWKSLESFSVLIMHWNVAQRELPVSE